MFALNCLYTKFFHLSPWLSASFTLYFPEDNIVPYLSHKFFNVFLVIIQSAA